MIVVITQQSFPLVGIAAPPPPPPPITCVVAGTRILMADGTRKAIETIRVGERVKTLNGRGGLVVKTDSPEIGIARHLMFLEQKGNVDRRLVITDDHDVWVDEGSAGEGFGTYNYNQWLYEAQAEGTTDCPIKILFHGREYFMAVEDGWTRVTARTLETDPKELVYGLYLDDGAGYFAAGFAIAAGDYTLDHVKDIRWKGLSDSLPADSTARARTIYESFYELI